MTHHDEIDYPALHATLMNGNREDAAAIIRSSDNPAWTVLRLLREMARFHDPAHLLDDVVNLQGLTEFRCISPIKLALGVLEGTTGDWGMTSDECRISDAIDILRGKP